MEDGGCLALRDLAFNGDRTEGPQSRAHACAFSNYIRMVRRGLNCLANIDLSLNLVYAALKGQQV